MFVDVGLHGFAAIVIGREEVIVVVGAAGVHEVLDVLRPHPVQRFRDGPDCVRGVAKVVCGNSQLLVKDGRLVIPIVVARFEKQEMARCQCLNRIGNGSALRALELGVTVKVS